MFSFVFQYKYDCTGDGVIICVTQRQCVYTGWDKVCVEQSSVCTWREIEWVRGQKQCLSTGGGWYLLELLLFILSPSRLCNMETERALAQNAWVCLAGCCTIARVPWGSMQTQTPCQPIHKQEDEESRTNSPSFLALGDYLVWPLLSFLVPPQSTQTPYHSLWPHVDPATHFETLIWWSGALVLFGEFQQDFTVWIRPVGSSRTDNEDCHLAYRKFSSALDSY